MKRNNAAALSVLSTFLLCFSFPVCAETLLPEGTVAGLPEKLTVLDSDGVSPNEKGEYFFHVEGMEYGETYTKNIQIMNLREDKAYHIYFYVEPLEKAGEIDLENEVDCTISLNGAEVFSGDVFGKGTIDLTAEPLDLGYYQPGDSASFSCSVTWTGTDADIVIDEGARLVDRNGMVILRDRDGDRHIYGEITYKWIFYAVVDEEYQPPYTGFLGAENNIWLVLIAASAAMVLVLCLLLLRKKRKAEKRV